MHTEMWLHAATQANVTTLRSRGAVVVRPDVGRLAGPDAGVGRLPDPAELFAVAVSVLEDPGTAVRAASQDMADLKVVVSAGGTRERLDPVRFLGNSSSGLMGWALARAAVLRGAEVRLVAANVGLPAPPGAEVEAVGSTADLAQAMAVAAKDADIAVMAAAPALFRPEQTRARSWSASPRKPQARDRRCWIWAEPSLRARAATCWFSTRSARILSSVSRTVR
jgi:phosphopantothenoylcysteine decarboxylase/phosphopantothenate--cysteine ligase